MLRLPSDVLYAVADGLERPGAMIRSCRHAFNLLWGRFIDIVVHPRIIASLLGEAHQERRTRAQRIVLRCRSIPGEADLVARMVGALPCLCSVVVKGASCRLHSADLLLMALPSTVHCLRMYLACNRLEWGPSLCAAVGRLPRQLSHITLQLDATSPA